MATSISHSPTETEALGEAWGRAARAGLVIGLVGELGAGKTQLVKGLARGLGITERVRSPTFALVNIYTGGRLTLFHIDTYRLETAEQISSAGLEEYLDPAGVTVIEWADRLFAARMAKAGQVHESRSIPSESPVEAAPRASKIRSPFFDSPPSQLLWVEIETLSPTTRRITYEGPGA